MNIGGRYIKTYIRFGALWGLSGITTQKLGGGLHTHVCVPRAPQKDVSKKGSAKTKIYHGQHKGPRRNMDTL